MMKVSDPVCPVKADAVEKIVRTAGSRMLHSSREIIREKGTSVNYTTSCDLMIEQQLEEELPHLLPGSSVFGEENHASWDPDGIQWIVDPLDGTANFRHGLCASSVSAALMIQRKIVLGIVYDPGNGRMFSAIRGGGAFLNGSPVRVSDEPMEKSLAFVQLGVYRKENAALHASSILKLFHACEDIRSFGSAALELALLGAGRAELFYAPRLFPWDFAAASLIVQEAGGVIGSLDRKNLFSGKPCSVWAANTAGNQDQLLQLLGQSAGTIRKKCRK